MAEIFRKLPPNERDGFFHVISTVFGGGSGTPDPDQPGGHVNPWRDNDYFFACDVDGKTVSTVHLMRRYAYVQGGEWSFGAIAGVATLPEFRGRGYSQELVRMAGKQMTEDGVDFGLLLTGINPFYEKANWFTVPRRAFSITFQETPSQKAEIVKDAPWQELMPIYQAFNQNRPFAIARTQAYWEGWANAWFKGARWLLIREGSEIVAYAALRKDGDTVHLWEVGWYPDRPNAATALAEQIKGIPSALDVKSIYAPIPDEPALISYLEIPGINVERQTERGLMALVVKQPEDALRSQCRIVDEGRGVFWHADFF